MEDFDPRTWTNIPTWRANLEMRFTENPEDFAGLGLDEIIDALINHTYKAVESENPLATDLAESFLFDVDWQNIAYAILDMLDVKQMVDNSEERNINMSKLAEKFDLTEKTNGIAAYKGFDQDLKCRGFQFEIGKTYKHEGKVSVCNSGFHACENPLAVFEHYPPTSRFAIVKCAGEISKDINDKKIACGELTVEAEIQLPELISEAVEWINSRVDLENKKISNTGNYSVASNAGNYSVASNTGNYSMASNAGEGSVASNTGNLSVASNTGNYSMASNAGNYSMASNAGCRSVASNAGNWSVASNAGDWSVASNAGEGSVASSTGYQSAAEVSGLQSIACALGEVSKAKAAAGGAIVCVYRNDDGDLIHIRSAKVGDDGIKADTWYMLDDTGEFVERE